MKRTAKAELRGKSVDELKKMGHELREGMFKGRIAGAVEGKGLGGKARQMRRQIARIETLLSEQRIGIKHAAAKPAAKAAPKAAKAKTEKPAAKAGKASEKTKAKA
jgi:ribosomal protein L29